MHDLGKLNPDNQAELHRTKKRVPLPINHVDAGTAVLLQQDDQYAALNVYSHHRGLPNMDEELCRESSVFRDDHIDVRNTVDAELGNLLNLHSSVVQEGIGDCAAAYNGDQGVFFRMMLSCLADADHSDTALHYGHAPNEEKMPELRASERLAALDKYVSGLGSTDERSILRKAMYTDCRNSQSESAFSICSSPVGSGKTTAIMAHMLQQANQRGARRIFVVLPYTSIIQQSVDVYRKSLVLPNEDPQKVVAELHCRADFDAEDTRYLTAMWRAPIVVTTAVSFFETLASNKPSSLRRLHELPGSLIFIDESHNALPLKLLPLAWHWMNILADEWKCSWILASGSLVHFWKLQHIAALGIPQPTVKDIVHTSLLDKLMQYEKSRIHFLYREYPLSRSELVDFLQTLPGPRLLILNTVQTAAVIANDIALKTGRNTVEHLSTALSSEDRDITIERVRKRLSDSSDTDWTLVATSCVEAGVDFSFKSGLREFASLLSLLQAAGRVNRHGTCEEAEMWSFSLQDDSMLKGNPELKISTDILKSLLQNHAEISPELCTEAMNRELLINDHLVPGMQSLLNDEDALQFKTVADNFSVIDSDTVTAIVDTALCAQIRAGYGDWQQLQKKAVAIHHKKVKQWNLEEIAKGIYRWTLGYDSFLGYMRGVLDCETAKKDTLIL